MLKDEGVVAAIETGTNVVVHGVNVGLIDRDALFGEGRGVVDGDAVEFRMSSPVLVEQEKELLRSAKHKDGQEDTSSALDDVMDL